MDYGQLSLTKHKQHRGKLEIASKFGQITTREDLSLAYTPGVAAVSSYLAQNPKEARDYSIKGNTIAVVSDGSAVLGLGNIGPLGALPVMEGKALLFKQFGGVDAYPIVLNTQDTEEIIRVVKAISPTFAGINLEDISSPRCFTIEERLSEELDIPVFHDDQHGTAIVILAALMNSLEITGKDKTKIKVVISGVGAAGISTARLLVDFGVKNIIMVDTKGIVSKNRTDLNSEKQKILNITNPNNISGDLNLAMDSADIFIGVSAPGILSQDMVASMSPQSVVFAMANPIPEIMPVLARAGGAFIVGTGRSDFANQINNVLAFPGLFRGLLDNNISKVTTSIKLATATAIASCVKQKDLSPDMVVPSALDQGVALKIAEKFKEFGR